MHEHLDAVAEAFSRKADIYDAFGEDHPNLAAMRAKVRAHLLSLLQPGDRILEINAGTGADAAFFASRNFKVHATDISPLMVSRIQAKIEALGLQETLTCQQLSFTELDHLREVPGISARPPTFNALLSNMGGLNCIQDLAQVARNMQPFLVPGAVVVCVIMPPICLWELASFFGGHFKTAFRRLSPRGVLANVEGVQFKTFYFTPVHVLDAFGDQFIPLDVLGLGVFTPPADHKDFAIRHPRFNHFLSTLEMRFADAYPFYQMGDFFILSLRYQPHRQAAPHGK